MHHPAPASIVATKDAAAGSVDILAQRLLRPEQEVVPLEDMFVHPSGLAGYDSARDVYFAATGGKLDFNTYFNAFQANAYDLDPEDRLVLRIVARGDMMLTAVGASPDAARVLFRGRLHGDDFEPIEVTLSPPGEANVVHLRIDAISDVDVDQIDWLIRSTRVNPVQIEAVITTFKRDDAVQETCTRLQAYADRNPDIDDHFQLTVIDNGGDTDSIPYRRGRLIKNRNLGGAGGFTRGLLDARARDGVTHVLFMDDDGAFFPEALRRTIAILRKARRPDVAVSGAMLVKSLPWRMWENTAVFDGLCRPLDQGLDLRQFGQVMSATVDRKHLAHRYGGWWYFCFPIAATRRLPFPFFVRGDDVHFSLSNSFEIRTALGVCSLQDSFDLKRSPLTIYLDTRNHIVQLLSHQGLRSKAKLRESLLYLFRSNNDTYHYGTADAVIVAMQDVMKGPDFWDEDVTMAAGRAKIKERAGGEFPIKDLEYGLRSVTPVRPSKHTKKKFVWLMRASLNGHRLPDFVFYTRSAIFSLRERFLPNQVFLRREAVVVDEATGEGYRLKIDRKRFFDNRRRFRQHLSELESRFDELAQLYAEGGEQLMGEGAWRSRLGLDAEDAEANAPKDRAG